MTGRVGTLINLLDKCLVDGYGAKAAAGWTHPVATASNIASYKMPSGTGFALVINDAGANVTSTFKEAWATGWESVAGVGSPVGSGTGQFPTAAQLLTSGHTVIRKSFDVSDTARDWILFADSKSFYFFNLSGDTAVTYQCFGFGDIYSYGGTGDLYRCLIMGGNTENTGGATNSGIDYLSAFNTAVAGNYMARQYSAIGGSLAVGKHGEATKGSGTAFLGTGVYPNTSDAGGYLSPIFVHETGGPSIRGTLRGLYQPLHPIASFTDLAALNGNGAYAGKTFICIKTSRHGGVILVETSNTLATN